MTAGSKLIFYFDIPGLFFLYFQRLDIVDSYLIKFAGGWIESADLWCQYLATTLPTEPQRLPQLTMLSDNCLI